MATFKFEGLEEYMAKLDALSQSTDEIVGKALYQGAKVLADAVSKEIDGIPTYHKTKGPKKIPATGLTEEQKKGLKEGLGIADFWRDSTGTYTKIGIKGYNSVKTKKYPKGQPNPLIARSIKKGTSYLLKHDFVARALASSKDAATKAIEKELDTQIAKLQK